MEDESHSNDWSRYWSGSMERVGSGPGGLTRWAMSILGAAGVRTVLDLGCGPGRDLAALLEAGFSVVGVDAAPAAVALAREAVRRLPPGVAARARVEEADLREFLAAQPDGSADAVHAAVTYQFLTDPEWTAVFREVARVLRPGGLHVWSMREPSHPGATHPDQVPPNRPGEPVRTVPQFRSLEAATALAGPGWTRTAFARVPTLHVVYVVDRTGAAGAERRPPRGRRD
jgi:SAM-dependent methyltransferase